LLKLLKSFIRMKLLEFIQTKVDTYTATVDHFIYWINTSLPFAY